VKPLRAVAAENAIVGKKINDANALMAGQAAVAEAKPLHDNGYMVEAAKTLVKKAVLECG
jgi:CO/xanthine dehydrogenase FAD-binding subunit